MSNSSDTEIANNPVSCDAPFDPASELFRQGNKFARDEQFFDAERVFRAAASLPDGKAIWNYKSLGFCPSIFPDASSMDAYWQQLDQGLDQVLAEHFDIDWRTLPADGFVPPFNLSHHGRCCKDIRAKFARIFEPFFPQERPMRKSRQRHRIGFLVFSGHEGGFLRGTAGILRQLDWKRFDVVVLCPGSLVDRCRQSIHSDDVTFVPLRGTFEQLAEQARACLNHLAIFSQKRYNALDASSRILQEYAADRTIVL